MTNEVELSDCCAERAKEATERAWPDPDTFALFTEAARLTRVLFEETRDTPTTLLPTADSISGSQRRDEVN